MKKLSALPPSSSGQFVYTSRVAATSRKSPHMKSILWATPYTCALCLASFRRCGHSSTAMTRSQVSANWMALPPTPAKASTMTEHLHCTCPVIPSLHLLCSCQVCFSVQTSCPTGNVAQASNLYEQPQDHAALCVQHSSWLRDEVACPCNLYAQAYGRVSNEQKENKNF